MNATGGTGSTLGVNITGSSNQVTTAQGGTIDSNVRVTVTGTSNSVTVRTTN
jgi:hypothetical protein